MPIFDDDTKPGANAPAPKAPTVPGGNLPGTNPAPTVKQEAKLSPIELAKQQEKIAKDSLLSAHLSPWDNYKPSEGSEKTYHLLIENVIVRDFEYKSTPRVVKISSNEFRSYWFNHYGLGLTIHRILHDPNPTRTEALKAEVEQLRINGKTL